MYSEVFLGCPATQLRREFPYGHPSGLPRPSPRPHLAELERRQALRRQHQPDVDPPVTDSAETENSPIGFVPQLTDPAVPEAPAARRTPPSPGHRTQIV